MQLVVSLNGLYSDYLAGLRDKKDIEEAIFKVLKSETRLLPGWNADDYRDYISWLYPRISRAINSYCETGSTFESYIYSLVRMTAKEYRAKLLRNYTAESAAWITQIPDMYAHEPEPEYFEDTGKITLKIGNPRQLLILVLKCCSYISPDFVEKISPIVGVQPDELVRMFNWLREQRKKRDHEINRLRELANFQFHRCLYYEQTLRAMPEENAFTKRMRERLERRRKGLANTRKKLAQLHSDPANCQIAELLGISKGAVDSTLYNMKTRGIQGLDKHILN
jgi:DNA-directed RNA polymerase specialized sigma24 family protein